MEISYRLRSLDHLSVAEEPPPQLRRRHPTGLGPPEPPIAVARHPSVDAVRDRDRHDPEPVQQRPAAVVPPDRPLIVRLNRSASGWARLRDQLAQGEYGLLLAGAGEQVLFMPAPTVHTARLPRVGELTLSDRIAFDPNAGTITVDEGPL